ncbi:helicase-exonuclease AddAB subunit AddA [Heyndrickxia ginsengihumi]|uniref:helicase-exonuclease AddAB subunit AddA n=1 Tax=Heyndrickxia ginsengihumi TaxID=363870 RepID=UPI003D245934
MKTAIPIKPVDATWTDDQWKAIMAKDQDILVAAAAGSGKTAVLVEKIIQKILDEKAPLDIDQLLIVTFTNAAAAEMRHRIGEAIEKALMERQDSHHLRRQLGLLNKASISTLHSFCLEVIRKYYYLTNIDPGFRIADDTEAELLRDEVLDDLFEAEYGSEDPTSFYRVVDTFSNDRSDEQLQELIRKLYDFSRSHPDPIAWLDQLVEMYSVNENMDIDSLPFIDSIRNDVNLQLQGAKELLKEALHLAKQPGGPAPRTENYLNDIEIVDRLLKANEQSWNDLYTEINAWSFTRAKSCKGDDFIPDLVKAADDLRKSAKMMLEKLKEELFSRKPQYFLKDMEEMQPVIAALAELVKKFSYEYARLKMEKGLVDFSDLEHYCLEILLEKTSSNEIIPSEAAKSYQSQFKEVLVDEYQDVNMVQETIIQLITSGRGYDGNLFMVGDVKQSIYRFRLADPNLFLTKYQTFTTNGEQTGLRIDLSKNFRSRKEILYGTNYIFKQIMGSAVGEMSYDKQAELVKGASYPENKKFPIELAIIDQSDEDSNEEEAELSSDEGLDQIELEQSQLEARFLAQKIKELIQEKKEIYNPKIGASRPIQYKDIVILLRSMTWAPEIMEEFKKQGIPIYANLSTGYFDATEIAIMMSLLKVIDNPYQDIPIAVVLRSPIVGLDEEQLAEIRVHSKYGQYYEAVTKYIAEKSNDTDEKLYEKLSKFLEKLKEWRSIARQGALSELIWLLYRETGFYDFVGGLPGGKQRQANLRALYDRARQYEETSFRGLFRFLRFIERMQDRGDDLGVARSLSEQEDVVRLMTVHSSKGLEFPVVFLAGSARKFNMRDLNQAFLFDKDYGFACKYLNPEKRISYPSLPQLAFKRKKKLETLSEEMRVLYVALTRAKERLYIVGTVKNANKLLKKWENIRLHHSEWLLNDHLRVQANSFLDWIGPSIVRHRDADALYADGMAKVEQPCIEIYEDPSCWNIRILSKKEFLDVEQLEVEKENEWIEIVEQQKTSPIESEWKDEINDRLSWVYPYKSASVKRAKQSVSEIKRMYEIRDEASDSTIVRRMQKPIFNRPRFMQEKSITPAERGTAMHMVMQHISFDKLPTVESISALLERMEQQELLTKEQIEVISIEQIIQFFSTEIGLKLLTAEKVMREVPFSMSIPANELYPNERLDEEHVFIQGIFDCVIEEENGLILLDYKTDQIQDRFKGGLEEARPILEKRYKIQLDLYERALETILKKKVNGKFLYFFDGGYLLHV